MIICPEEYEFYNKICIDLARDNVDLVNPYDMDPDFIQN
jgi:hypothetical protein